MADAEVPDSGGRTAGRSIRVIVDRRRGREGKWRSVIAASAVAVSVGLSVSTFWENELRVTSGLTLLMVNALLAIAYLSLLLVVVSRGGVRRSRPGTGLTDSELVRLRAGARRSLGTDGRLDLAMPVRQRHAGTAEAAVVGDDVVDLRDSGAVPQEGGRRP